MVTTVIAYVALGANLQSPKQQLLRATNLLALDSGILTVTSSSTYQSAPMGPQDQPDYINAVVQVCTTLKPDCLLDVLQAIEYKLGRNRTDSQHWGARVIDLDLLLYANETIQSERLQVPHYDMKQRAFVLYPLLELNPALCLPCGATLQHCCDTVPRCDLQRLEPPIAGD
jgi:2-amino-4-hydroxy-6-hydroxymethyldihydropteridine diphosphokinase